jgi:uncharacterized delta-60 repeat protein
MLFYKRLNRLSAAGLFLLLLNLSLLATGVFDPTFGNNGKISLGWQPVSTPFFIKVQPDQKIIVIGTSSNSVTVARYNENGSMDAAFGIRNLWGGFVRDAQLQPDGKILVAGLALPGPVGSDMRSVVSRVNSDGSPDAGFGAGGRFTVDRYANDNFSERISAVVSLPDGKVLGIIQNLTVKEYFRLNANGQPDTTFGNQGYLPVDSVLNFVNTDSFLKPVANNKFLVGSGAMISRINADGTTDSSFGNGGFVQSNGSLADIVVQPDEKFIVAGGETRRFLSDGTVDATFRVTGKSSKLALFPDGRFASITDNPVNPSQERNAVMQVQSPVNYVIGKALRTIQPFQNFDFTSVAVQADGKILVGRTNDGLYRYRNVTSLGNQTADLDADEKTDISVYRPTNRAYYFLKSRAGFESYIADTPATSIIPEDYNADYRSDLVWWAASGTRGCFYGFHSFNPPSECSPWGLPNAIPLGGDYDGDNKTDFTVVHDGVWHILQSSTQTARVVPWGYNTDKPVPADYDGDGKTDIAVFRPASGTWHILQSGGQPAFAYQFGVETDKPVAADYDGDGRADIAVFRPSNGVWYLLQTTGGFSGFRFGASEDRPVPGDYDGDGKTDLAVWRPSTGVWYLSQTANGLYGVQWGQNGDIPLSTSYSTY